MDYFLPSSERGLALRQAMDDALWQSAASAIGQLPPTRTPPGRARLQDYGAYADLAFELPAWQQVGEASRDEARAYLAGRLSGDSDANLVQGDLPTVVNLPDAGASPIQVDRLYRWFVTEESVSLDIQPAEANDVEAAREAFAKALDVLAIVAPEAHGETVAMIGEIVAVSQGPKARFEFTASTSFALWGGIAIKADVLCEWVECFNTCLHEGGHNALLALARDEPLVRNPGHETTSSPVRDDPRPLDGIFHAAFVTAREAFGLDRLLAWDDRTGNLSPDERMRAEESLEVSIIAFWQSMDILREKAELTELGSNVLRDCETFMEKRFSLVFD